MDFIKQNFKGFFVYDSRSYEEYLEKSNSFKECTKNIEEEDLIKIYLSLKYDTKGKFPNTEAPSKGHVHLTINGFSTILYSGLLKRTNIYSDLPKNVKEIKYLNWDMPIGVNQKALDLLPIYIEFLNYVYNNNYNTSMTQLFIKKFISDMKMGNSSEICYLACEKLEIPQLRIPSFSYSSSLNSYILNKSTPLDIKLFFKNMYQDYVTKEIIIPINNIALKDLERMFQIFCEHKLSNGIKKSLSVDDIKKSMYYIFAIDHVLREKYYVSLLDREYLDKEFKKLSYRPVYEFYSYDNLIKTLQADDPHILITSPWFKRHFNNKTDNPSTIKIYIVKGKIRFLKFQLKVGEYVMKYNINTQKLFEHLKRSGYKIV